ncbi:homoserine dehydrogenase [Alkalicoccobacillus murimartini]|uniref:Homoserine dehydrogenase n=1 Tax=Alkalicoccobacillus murimartini TaxID=171685 RepID=A0ABT9YG58_9BACI|nr:homoserine dehydrogenase [Alkalicoccobacillus murimartini]MDQ0206853.1 homoserine dehydrogenase [Alkalicoccobacillus murimartini]
MKIYISGFGSVSRAMIELIIKKQTDYIRRYQLELKVVGLIGRHGLLEDQNGLNLETLLRYDSGSAGIHAYAMNEGLSIQTDYIFHGDVLVEAAPTHQEHGEPGYGYMKQALTQGLDVVALSKGALVHHYNELMSMANEYGQIIQYSGAVAAALPTLDVGRYCLAGTTISGFEAILNGTSNYILSEMMDTGKSFADILLQAQEKGIAETNPSLDVEGIDSANKLALLANSLLETSSSFQDVSLKGIEDLTSVDLTEALRKGQKVRLVARAKVENDQVTLSVKPEYLSTTHPLSTVHGTNKGILFSTEEIGELFVSGGASSPVGAASAAIKDIINLTKLKD